MVALIPARAGSKRIPWKNTRVLGGKALVRWTIEAARESGVFSEIYVCTDDPLAVDIAASALVPYISRPHSSDDEPDVWWVKQALTHVAADAFAILRPTAPFRTAATIRRAFEQFSRMPDIHSIRAVQPVKEHPGKMWTWEGPGYPMKPYGIQQFNDPPDHSRPTQTLRKVYVQNASLEMAWTYVVEATGTISGTKIAPFFTEGYEGFDLNTMDDWREAERLIKEGLVDLPSPLARV